MIRTGAHIILIVTALLSLSCSKVKTETVEVFTHCGARFLQNEENNKVILVCNQEVLNGLGGEQVKVEYTIVERCDAEHYASSCPNTVHDVIAFVTKIQ